MIQAMQAIPNMRIIWGDKKLFLCAKDKIVSFAEKKQIVNTTNGSCASKTWHPLSYCRISSNTKEHVAHHMLLHIRFLFVAQATLMTQSPIF